MADPGFGVSFLPGGDANYSRESGASPAPMQEAIKVLSLRVPRVVGASPLAPLALLQSQGGGGLPAGILEALLRRLMPPSAGTPAATPPVPTTTPASPMMAPAGVGPAVTAAPAGVGPTVSGAPSAVTPAAATPPVLPGLTSSGPPPVKVTAGVQEPLETLPSAPPAAPAPDVSVTAQGPSAEDLWNLARQMVESRDRGSVTGRGRLTY